MRAVAAVAAVAVLAACASPYRGGETGRAAPRDDAERREAIEPDPAAREAGERREGVRDTAPGPPESGPGAGAPPVPADGAIVGTVAPDGTFRADTLAEAPPEPAVERETVVSGAIRSGGIPRAAPARSAVAAGWRVQVFAARDREGAEAVARDVEARLGGPDAVHVVAEDGWHKVRVGDLVDRDRVDDLRARLAALGWPEAFVVRTAVRAGP